MKERDMPVPDVISSLDKTIAFILQKHIFKINSIHIFYATYIWMTKKKETNLFVFIPNEGF